MKRKLEVLSENAAALDRMEREDPLIWNRCIRLAAQMLQREDGRTNAYPVKKALREDLETKTALRIIARASDRSRWVFMNAAARELIRQYLVRP